MTSSAHGRGREARNRHGSSELYKVAPPSPGAAGPSLARATSSAWSNGLVSREWPMASTAPSAATMMAPTA